MLEFSAARVIAFEAGHAVSRVEHVSLTDAAGRTLAAPVIATAPLPGFDSAAMDGWAVNGNGPWVLGSPISAGDDVPTVPLAIGAARPISTEAPVPPHAARVLR